MRRSFLKGLLASLTLGWVGPAARAETTREPRMQEPKTEDLDRIAASFDLATLKKKQATGSRTYLPFFENRTMSMGLYVLAAGAEDPQSPHREDEVYYIDEGKGMLQLDGTDYPVSRGSVVFVKARAAHRFHSIEQDLKVLVFFSKAASG